MTFFVLGALAALLGIAVNAYVQKRYSDEYRRRYDGAGIVNANQSYPYGISPKFFELWMRRALDVSSSLPALILAIAGMFEINILKGPLGVGCLVLASAAICILVLSRVDPKRPPTKSKLAYRILSTRPGPVILSFGTLLLLLNGVAVIALLADQ